MARTQLCPHCGRTTYLHPEVPLCVHCQRLMDGPAAARVTITASPAAFERHCVMHLRRDAMFVPAKGLVAGQAANLRFVTADGTVLFSASGRVAETTASGAHIGFDLLAVESQAVVDRICMEAAWSSS